MKRYVKSAEYKYYNANSRGNNVGDCVKRSISLAFDIPYTKVTKDLNRVLREYQDETGKYWVTWTARPVWTRLVKEYGSSEFVELPQRVNQDKFADTYDGTYITVSGKFNQNGGMSEGHACCIIDHVIYDSWNSKNHEVYGYFKILEPGQHRQETDIKDRIKDLGYLALSQMETLVSKYLNKYNILNSVCNISNDISVKGYSFKCKGYLTFRNDSIESKYLDSYDLSFVVVLTPTTTYDEGVEIVKKTVYQKIYDRFYYIRKDMESKKEAYELSLSSEYGKTDPDYLFMDGREERFLKSLPAWVSKFITYISIQYPGQYDDSVKVYIRPLPGDPNPDKSRIHFEGYTQAQVRDMLDRYKKKWERPWDDYNPNDEY